MKILIIWMKLLSNNNDEILYLYFIIATEFKVPLYFTGMYFIPT